MKMRGLITISYALLAIVLYSGIANAQTSIFSCPSGFNLTTGACGVAFDFYSSNPFGSSGTNSGCSPSSLTGSSVPLSCVGDQHSALSLNYMTAAVNVQAFNTTFTFVPNGYNVSFILNNTTNFTGGKSFSGGAGCEADFFQGFNGTNPPNNIFALSFDSWQPAVNGNSFGYSSVQIYQSNLPAAVYPNINVQCPCQSDTETCGTNNSDPSIAKISTSPVPLNSPSGTSQTTTGDTYSANIVYDGSNVTLNLYDVTAGGSCPGASCFTNKWTNVNIPSSVGANTAWVGLGGAIPSITPANALLISSFSYTVEPPASTYGSGVFGGGAKF